MSETTSRSIPHRTAGKAHVVTLRGEIDLLTAPALRAHLDSLTAGPGPDLVLDLRRVSFIDCSGLGVLCRARNRVLARHGRLRLVTDSVFLRRVLWHAGLAGVFEVLPGLPEGLAGTQPAGIADVPAV
ncbi:STAS domain-containing protein [Streptomyces iakyrus]|uniref:STAS domain-containing protein n=1 Tax=Streptomyces iakyrus TaxID=68219 RepID=UPI00068F42B4|nr:STAS domain-containing protein [Streptomyces iakyrus]